MLIVVEGAPLTGKTTLARALALDIIDEGRDAQYVHSEPAYGSDSDVGFIKPLDTYHPGGLSIVLDEWHIGGTFEPYGLVGPRDFDNIEHYLKIRGALLVRCERAATHSKIFLMSWRYDSMFHRSNLPYVTYCFDVDGGNNARRTILGLAKLWENTAMRETNIHAERVMK